MNEVGVECKTSIITNYKNIIFNAKKFFLIIIYLSTFTHILTKYNYKILNLKKFKLQSVRSRTMDSKRKFN